jgi:hypothetical protein
MQRDRGADNPGAKNYGIGALHDLSSAINIGRDNNRS